MVESSWVVFFKGFEYVYDSNGNGVVIFGVVVGIE